MHSDGDCRLQRQGDETASQWKGGCTYVMIHAAYCSQQKSPLMLLPPSPLSSAAAAVSQSLNGLAFACCTAMHHINQTIRILSSMH
jgi:hypothetical protein